MITIWSTLPHGHPSLRKRAPAAPLRARVGHPRHPPARPDLHGHPGPRRPARRPVRGRSLRGRCGNFAHPSPPGRKSSRIPLCSWPAGGPQTAPGPVTQRNQRQPGRPIRSVSLARARACPGPLLGADVRGVHAVAGVTDMVGRVGNGRCCRVVSRGAGVVAAVSDGLAEREMAVAGVSRASAASPPSPDHLAVAGVTDVIGSAGAVLVADWCGAGG